MASFISSLLNSVGGGAGSTGSPVSSAVPARSQSTSAVAGIKRKADGELSRSGEKAAKLANGVPSNARNIKPLPTRPLSAANKTTTPSGPSTIVTPKSAPAAGGKPPGPPSNRYALSNGKSMPTSRSVTTISTTTRPVDNTDGRRPTSKAGTSVPLSAKPAAKKGSFKAMLAQAQQAQQSAPPVGAIVDKKTMSTKQRLAAARTEAARGKEAGKKAIKSAANGKVVAGKDARANEAVNASGKYQGTAKPKVARPQPTYTGTARPSAKPATQPSYRGTARPNAEPASRAPAKSARKYHRNEYLGTDEEESEDDYGDDDRYDEASDDYSDMEGGVWDLDEEERIAEKAAKEDDAKEQRELERLAREKAARKKGMR